MAATVGIRSFAKTGETADGMEYTATLSDNSTYVFIVKTAVDYPISVANGGTGATTAAAARANLGALSNANGAVGTANLGGKAVTAEKIADKTVTAAKLADNIPYTKFGLAADQVRKITFGTAAPSGGSNGDVYIRYS